MGPQASLALSGRDGIRGSRPSDGGERGVNAEAGKPDCQPARRRCFGPGYFGPAAAPGEQGEPAARVARGMPIGDVHLKNTAQV
jgi:hypothetical protein